MDIALDYDDTYTRDPETWDMVSAILRSKGHRVLGVTFRYDDETEGMLGSYAKACDEVHFTGRVAKSSYMHNLGITISVWIDDNPLYILTSL